MKRNHIFNITVDTGFSFFAKVTGDHVDEFRDWVSTLPGITQCVETSSVSPIKGHTSSNTKMAKARMEAGLLQTEVADRIGIRYQQYARYETGRVTPKAATLRRIGEVLGVEDWITLIEEE